MRVFEVAAEFTEDGKIIPPTPIDVPPGKYMITVDVQTEQIEETAPLRPKRSLPFRAYNITFKDQNYTRRRGNLYDRERG
jgi:hypothetical protein